MVEHIVHIDGAPKPKRPQCGMKQGEADRQTLGLLPCETTGSSPVATTKAEPNRKARLIAYSFG